jgi:hypothetical protein
MSIGTGPIPKTVSWTRAATSFPSREPNQAAHHCNEAEQFVISLCYTTDGFAIDSDARLIPPPDDAQAMSQLMANNSFMEPHEPRKNPD